MKDKINIYIPVYIDTILSFINYSDKINIVLDEKYYMKNSKSYINYDSVLYLDGNIATPKDDLIFKCKILNIPILGIPRLDKLHQTLFLNENNINTPDTFYCDITNINDICSLISNVSDLYVLKIDKGARGLGQALLTYNELIALYETENNILDKIYKEETKKQQYNLDIKNDNIESVNTDLDILEPSNKSYCGEYSQLDQLEQYNKLINIKWNMHSLLIEGIKNRKDLILQKYIKNRLEYRIIWFYSGDPIIIKRDLDTDQWQANACNNSSNSSHYLTETYNDKLEIELFNKYVDMKLINTAFNKLDTPFLSVDIYIDTDTNQFGVFEFQMEFGWTKTYNFPYNLVQENIENSILKLVKDKNPNK